MSIKETWRSARNAVEGLLAGDSKNRERPYFNPYPKVSRYYPRPEISDNSWRLKIDLLVEDLPSEESVKQLIDKLIQFFDSNGIDYTQKGPEYNNFYALIIGWAESDDFLGIPKKNDYYALLYQGLKSTPELNDMWQQFWNSHQPLLGLYLEYLEIYKRLESMRDVLWEIKLNDRAPTDIVDQYVCERCVWFTGRSRELFRLSRHLEGLIIAGLNELGLDRNPEYLKKLRG